MCFKMDADFQPGMPLNINTLCIVLRGLDDQSPASPEAVCTDAVEQVLLQGIAAGKIPPAHLQDALTMIRSDAPFKHIGPLAVRVLETALQRS